MILVYENRKLKKVKGKIEGLEVLYHCNLGLMCLAS